MSGTVATGSDFKCNYDFYSAMIPYTPSTSRDFMQI